MSYYVTDFNKIRQEKSILKILQALVRGFEKFEIDFYLIGAVAREVWMLGLKDITPRRATSDIDFGADIINMERFNDLKNYLINIEGFTASKSNDYVLFAQDGKQIDILPFGIMEKDGKVTVNGMKEVFTEAATDVTFEDKITFKVCTLPGIVLLKLVAWDDRPEIRRDDLTDIADILNHFFKIYEEMIWEHHNDLFGEDKDLESISARVLGREMGKILKKNQDLKERILGILTFDNSGKAEKIAEIFAVTLDKSLEDIHRRLNEIFCGINEV